MQCIDQCDTSSPVLFEQPVLQTLQMFIGESGCWIVLLLMYLLTKESSTNYEQIGTTQKKLTFKSSLLLLIPACCDITGTTLMNVGLIYTPVSIYQMTRGSVVIFVAAMSMIFLSRRITRIDWLSLVTVSLGVVVVGLSGSFNSNSSTGEIIFGTCLIFIAMVFTASQFVVEEFIISRYSIPPLKLVGFEGIYGTLITLTLMVLGHLLGGYKSSNPFNMVESFQQMFSNKVILQTSILIMISIGSFNFFGISITDKLSATARSTIDTSRTLMVWIVSICLGWEHFSLLQLLGFALLVLGTLVFNKVIDITVYVKLPKFFTEEDRPKQPFVDETLEHF